MLRGTVMGFFLIGAAILGAVGNRVRGGLFPMPGGTQVARLVGWGVPCGAVAALAGVPWWGALLIGLGAFLGCMAGEHNSQSMGLKGGNSGLVAWGWMGLWGLERTVAVAIIVAFLHARTGTSPWWGLLVVGSGLTAPAIYYAVRWLPDWMLFAKGFGAGSGPGGGRDPAEWSEWLHGAIMMGVLSWAVATP